MGTIRKRLIILEESLVSVVDKAFASSAETRCSSFRMKEQVLELTRGDIELGRYSQARSAQFLKAAFVLACSATGFKMPMRNLHVRQVPPRTDK